MEYQSDPIANTLLIIFSSLQTSSSALVLFVACSPAQFFFLRLLICNQIHTTQSQENANSNLTAPHYSHFRIFAYIPIFLIG